MNGERTDNLTQMNSRVMLYISQKRRMKVHMIDDIVIEALYNAWCDGQIQSSKNFDCLNELIKKLTELCEMNEKDAIFAEKAISDLIYDHERAAFYDGVRIALSMIRGESGSR